MVPPVHPHQNVTTARLADPDAHLTDASASLDRASQAVSDEVSALAETDREWIAEVREMLLMSGYATASRESTLRDLRELIEERDALRLQVKNIHTWRQVSESRF